MNATSLRLSIRQWAPEDRPSEKIQKLGAEALTDAELISMLIGSGAVRLNIVPLTSHSTCCRSSEGISIHSARLALTS